MRRDWTQLPQRDQGQVLSRVGRCRLAAAQLQQAQRAVEACLSAEARAISYHSESDVTTWLSGFLGASSGAGAQGVLLALSAAGCLGHEALLTAHPARAVTANSFVALAQDVLRSISQALQLAAAAECPHSTAVLLLRAATRCLRCLLAAGTVVRYVHQLLPSTFPALLRCMHVDAGAVCSFIVDALTPLAASREGGMVGTLSFSSDTPTTSYGIPHGPASSEDKLASAACVASIVSPFTQAASAIQSGTDAEQAYFNAASSLTQAGVQSALQALQPPSVSSPMGGGAAGAGAAHASSEALWLSHCTSASAGAALLQVLKQGCHSSELRCRALSYEAWGAVAALPAAASGDLLSNTQLWAPVLQAAVNGVCLPAGFTTWEACEVDEDEFERFREQDAVELLGALCGRLGCAQVLAAAVQQVTERASHADKWLEVEAALFVVRAVHLQAKQCLRAAAKAAAGQPSAAGHLHAVLETLFAHLTARPAAVTAHSACIAAACRCLVYYSGWLAQHGELLAAAASLAMDSLGVPLAAEAAAAALLALSSRASKLFAKGDTVRRLALGVGTCLRSGAPVPAASSVVSAIMRVLAQVPPMEASDTLRQLLAEFSSQVGASMDTMGAATSADSVSQAASSCEAGLTLLAEATRFAGGLKADVTANPLAVAADAVITVCAKVLPAATGGGAGNVPASVYSSACSALAALLTAEQGRHLERLESILGMAVHVYRAHSLPEAAALVNSCIEYFGEGSVAAGTESAVSASARESVDALLQSAVGGILQHALTGSAEQQLPVAVYELGWGCMMRHPAALLTQQELAAAMYARAASALQSGPGQQRGLRSSLSFVSRFVAPYEAWQRAGCKPGVLHALVASRGTVDAVVNAHGGAMMQGLLHVILHNAQGASVMDPAAEALFQHLTAYHDACSALLGALLRDAGSQGGLPLPATPLWGSVKTAVAQVLTSFATPQVAAQAPSGAMAFLAETPLDRYKHAVGVVASVAAGATGADALEQLQLGGTKPAPDSSTVQIPRGAISFM